MFGFEQGSCNLCACHREFIAFVHGGTSGFLKQVVGLVVMLLSVVVSIGRHHHGVPYHGSWLPKVTARNVFMHSICILHYILSLACDTVSMPMVCSSSR